MTVSEMIWRAHGSPEVEGSRIEGTCCLCQERGALVKTDFIHDTFTNRDYLRNDSPAICQGCAFCLQNQFRRTSYLVTDSRFIALKRETISFFLFQENPLPNAWYITTSFKKHGFFKTKINHSNDRLYVQFEEIGIWFCPSEMKPIFDIIRLFYSIPKDEEEKAMPKSFFTKDEILYGNYSMNRLNNFGIEEWEELDEKIRGYRGAPCLELLTHCVSQEKLGREKKCQNQKKKEQSKKKKEKNIVWRQETFF